MDTGAVGFLLKQIQDVHFVSCQTQSFNAFEAFLIAEKSTFDGMIGTLGTIHKDGLSYL